LHFVKGRKKTLIRDAQDPGTLSFTDSLSRATGRSQCSHPSLGFGRSVRRGQVAGAQTVFNLAPLRSFGQAALQQTGPLTAIAPNLVEGREFNAPQGIAIDNSSSPAILYVVHAK